MSESILQPDEKKCFITGSYINLDKHHVYHGVGNRSIAEREGCWVWLRHDIHMKLHDKDKELDRYIEEECQKKFEETHSREEFRKLFGKSYL